VLVGVFRLRSSLSLKENRAGTGGTSGLVIVGRGFEPRPPHTGASFRLRPTIAMRCCGDGVVQQLGELHWHAAARHVAFLRHRHLQMAEVIAVRKATEERSVV
jgi:hypothetical protein